MLFVISSKNESMIL